jgi:hypothetical protein
LSSIIPTISLRIVALISGALLGPFVDKTPLGSGLNRLEY